MNYNNLTNPEIAAAIAGLEGEEREKALSSLEKGKRAAVDEALANAVPYDGARAAVLERLGREKQIADSQAWTADGVSPNSPLVTEAAAAKFTEAPAPEAVIDTLVAAAVAPIVEPVAEEPAKALSGKLPSGFPGKAELEAAGVTTYAQVRKLRDGDGLTSVAGIGDAKASQIEEAIKE